MTENNSSVLTMENVSIVNPIQTRCKDENPMQRRQPACRILAGTSVTTDKGDIPVEYLQPDDFILTKDSGYLPLRGIGNFSVSRWGLLRQPELRPIVFPKGSVGNDVDLRICGMHRIFLYSAFADMIFGTAEVLAPARSFVGHKGIHEARQKHAPNYFQILLDQHELISTSGTWSESLFLGDVALQSKDHRRNWIVANDFDLSRVRHNETARMALDQRESRVLFERMNG